MSSAAVNGVAGKAIDRYLSTVINNSAETFSLASRRLIRYSEAYAVLVVIVNGLGLFGLTEFTSGAGNPTLMSSQTTLAVIGTVAGFASLVCAFGLLISTVVWIISAHKERPSGPSFAGYGALVVCIALIAFAYVFPEDVSTGTAAAATELTMRVVGAVVLILGVRSVRSGISRRTGQPMRPSTSMVTTEDWDASQWDPEVLRDIERRRQPE